MDRAAPVADTIIARVGNGVDPLIAMISNKLRGVHKEESPEIYVLLELSFKKEYMSHQLLVVYVTLYPDELLNQLTFAVPQAYLILATCRRNLLALAGITAYSGPKPRNVVSLHEGKNHDRLVDKAMFAGKP